MTAKHVVFVGPSLRRAEAAALAPDATILGPARQGDVFHAVRGGDVAAVSLIDGAFLDRPAVWHREILWAMERGVHVRGAASMGALRAAELHRYGMAGVGTIFDAYRSGTLPGWPGPFEDDDEVAVIHAPAELNHAPASDAMVDLRITLGRATEAGVLSRAARDALAARLKALHFPRRTLAALGAAAIEAEHRAFAAWLPVGHVSQKRLDAVALLRSPIPAAAAAGVAMRQAETWRAYLADARRFSPAEAAAIEALKRDGARWKHLAPAALARMAHDGGPPDAAAARRALAAFCRTYGFATRDGLVAWASGAGLDEAALLRLAQAEYFLDDVVRANAGPALDGAILDTDRLAQRMNDRQARRDEAGNTVPDLSDDG